jgi:hypothetical protein
MNPCPCEFLNHRARSGGAPPCCLSKISRQLLDQISLHECETGERAHGAGLPILPPSHYLTLNSLKYNNLDRIAQ